MNDTTRGAAIFSTDGVAGLSLSDVTFVPFGSGTAPARSAHVNRYDGTKQDRRHLGAIAGLSCYCSPVSTYVIGDIQGCFASLMQLMKTIQFDRTLDRLWFVGDLVNRGPRSLEVLRWIRDLGDRATPVLGNHDLHLLALAEGVRTAKPQDTLEEVLLAPDRDELLDWLRHLPLLHRENRYVLVHAGLLPAWTTAQAEELACEASRAILSKAGRELLGFFQCGESMRWRRDLEETERLQLTLQVLTRIRTCDRDGVPCLDFSGPPAEAPEGCVPWFDAPGRQDTEDVVLFGHWAALGLMQSPRAIGLDTGCVWGGSLTALRLEDRQVFQVRNVD